MSLIRAAACAALLTLPAAAYDEPPTERLAFPVGAAEMKVTGIIKGYDTVTYLLAVEAGQSLKGSFTGNHRTCFVNLYDVGKMPGKAKPVMNGAEGGTTFELDAASAGDVAMIVYMTLPETEATPCGYTLELSAGAAD